MKKHFILFFVTVGYVGKLPGAPGTYGSLVGALFIGLFPNPWALWTLTFLTIGVGIFLSGPAENVLQKKDPGSFVLDEVAGMVVSVLGLSIHTMSYPSNLLVILVAFGVFRFFDTVKPLGIRYLDKKINHPASIMLDDILAGIYTNLVMRVLLLFIG